MHGKRLGLLAGLMTLKIRHSDMTDKELLELAAKAAGIEGWQSKHGYWNMKDVNGESVVCCYAWPKFDADTGKELNPTFADAVAQLNWNPLEDDGDALRLAVKLRMDVVHFTDIVRANVSDCDDCHEQNEENPYAATRRAIVRAAAEIGKSL